MNASIGSALIGIMIYFFKYYMDNLHQRISDIQSVHDREIREIKDRIINSEEKYRDLLDILLEKFSKWEDRILGIMSKIDKATPEEVSREISTFQKQHKEEMNDIKIKVARVAIDIKKMANDPYEDALKQMLTRKLEDQKDYYEGKFKIIEDNYLKLIRAVTTLNDRTKNNELKIENVQKSALTRIKINKN